MGVLFCMKEDVVEVLTEVKPTLVTASERGGFLSSLMTKRGESKQGTKKQMINLKKMTNTFLTEDEHKKPIWHTLDNETPSDGSLTGEESLSESLDSKTNQEKLAAVDTEVSDEADGGGHMEFDDEQDVSEATTENNNEAPGAPTHGFRGEMVINHDDKTSDTDTVLATATTEAPKAPIGALYVQGDTVSQEPESSQWSTSDQTTPDYRLMNAVEPSKPYLLYTPYTANSLDMIQRQREAAAAPRAAGRIIQQTRADAVAAGLANSDLMNSRRGSDRLARPPDTPLRATEEVPSAELAQPVDWLASQASDQTANIADQISSFEANLGNVAPAQDLTHDTLPRAVNESQTFANQFEGAEATEQPSDQSPTEESPNEVSVAPEAVTDAPVSSDLAYELSHEIKDQDQYAALSHVPSQMDEPLSTVMPSTSTSGPTHIGNILSQSPNYAMPATEQPAYFNPQVQQPQPVMYPEPVPQYMPQQQFATDAAIGGGYAPYQETTPDGLYRRAITRGIVAGTLVAIIMGILYVIK